MDFLSQKSLLFFTNDYNKAGARKEKYELYYRNRIDGELLPEIGFHVISQYCLNGYASEAARSIIAYCGNEYKLRKVFSYCNMGNEP